MSLSDRVDRVSGMIEELIEREQRLEIFLNASPWGILVVDQTFHMVYVNGTFERLSGYSMSELLGKHMHYVMPEEHHRIHTEHERDYVKNPRDRHGNHGLRPMVKCKSGNVVDVEISLSPVRIDGKAFFFASVRELSTLFNTVEGEVKKT